MQSTLLPVPSGRRVHALPPRRALSRRARPPRRRAGGGNRRNRTQCCARRRRTGRPVRAIASYPLPSPGPGRLYPAVATLKARLPPKPAPRAAPYTRGCRKTPHRWCARNQKATSTVRGIDKPLPVTPPPLTAAKHTHPVTARKYYPFPGKCTPQYPTDSGDSLTQVRRHIANIAPSDAVLPRFLNFKNPRIGRRSHIPRLLFCAQKIG